METNAKFSCPFCGADGLKFTDPNFAGIVDYKCSFNCGTHGGKLAIADKPRFFMSKPCFKAFEKRKAQSAEAA